MKRLTVLLLIVFLLSFVVPAFAQYTEGDHVEDFQLPDQQGNMVNLYDYQDWIVLIAWWTPGWDGCATEAEELEEYVYQPYYDQGVMILDCGLYATRGDAV